MQLVILSGKGGTGKTTIAASLAYLSKKGVNIDCDVDASNLHIILKGDDIEAKRFVGAKTAVIDHNLCIKCGNCEKACRFGAISEYTVDELKCEGCAACTAACRQNAIKLSPQETASTIITKTDSGILSRADMEVGAEGSGKIVTEVRKNASRYYDNNDLVILDGSPGVGCAVMASLTGCDAAIIVTEPTQSGVEDFMRVLALCEFFNLKVYVCINKYDINIEISEDIVKFCSEEGIKVLARIPFDETVKQAINETRPLASYSGRAADEIRKLWERLKIEFMEAI